MPARAIHRSFKPRELRRKLLVPARVRDCAGWSDACIVNISSRGLMIRSSRPIAPDSEVEIWSGDHAIAARVVWRDGARAGLRSEEPIPVEQILTVGSAPALQLAAPPKTKPRHQGSEERSRLRGRTMEFVATVAIGAAFALAGLSMVGEAFARPLAIVSAALGG